jgi:hypothetical protein
VRLVVASSGKALEEGGDGRLGHAECVQLGVVVVDCQAVLSGTPDVAQVLQDGHGIVHLLHYAVRLG